MDDELPLKQYETKKNDSSIMWRNRKETVADKIIKSISMKKG